MAAPGQTDLITANSRAQARCPAGKRVVGGGGAGFVEDDRVAVKVSVPLADGSGWSLTVGFTQQPIFGPIDFQADAFAICVAVP